MHKLMGNTHSQTRVSVNWKKQENMRKRYHSKTFFSYAGTSKATHKVFQQRVASSIRELSVLHNLQFFCTEIMAEDWVRLQLGVHLQIGVLRYLHKLFIRP